MIDDIKIIASLTSYGKRVNTVHLAIETILNQTHKADKVILWLAEDEFNENNIPNSLKSLVPRGLEIDFCEDIKSYKKLIPTLKKYPNDIIITFDDDIYYRDDVIEKLYNSYKKEPESIHCMRGHKMKFLSNGFLDSYNNWSMCIDKSVASLDIFPTTGGGALFPPNIFPSHTFKKELFMSLAPHADDVWFKAMSLLNNIKSVVVEHEAVGYSKRLKYIDNTQTNGLWVKNRNEEDGNNKQIKDVFTKYKLFLFS